MSFGKRQRLPDSWTEDEVHSQFPASAFNLEKSPAPQENHPAPWDAATMFSHLPCRILDDWYLVAKPDRSVLGYFACDDTIFSFPFRRAPLPIDTLDMRNYVLVGTLQAQQPEREAVKLELENLDFYTMDNTKRRRGYWVFTSRAKYWLRNPCSKDFTIKKMKIRLGGEDYAAMEDPASDDVDADGTETLSAQLPSQEQLHYFHPAQLGLLSNLQDILILPDGSYNSFLHNLSATQIDAVLTPSTQAFDFHIYQKQTKGENNVPKLFKHAFDLELLESSIFLLPHICAIDPHVATSRWYKELLRRKPFEETVGPLQSKLSQSCWVESASKAQARSHQLPSGEMNPQELGKNVDLLYPIELELQYQNSIRKRTTIAGGTDADLENGFSDDVPPTSLLPPLPRIEGWDMSAAPRTPRNGLHVSTEESPSGNPPTNEGDTSIQSALIGSLVSGLELIFDSKFIVRPIKPVSSIPRKRSLAEEQAQAVEAMSTATIPSKRFKTIVETTHALGLPHADGSIHEFRHYFSFDQDESSPSSMLTCGQSQTQHLPRKHAVSGVHGVDGSQTPPAKTFDHDDREVASVNYISPDTRSSYGDGEA